MKSLYDSIIAEVEIQVGAIIYYALAAIDNRGEGVINYGPYNTYYTSLAHDKCHAETMITSTTTYPSTPVYFECELRMCKHKRVKRTISCISTKKEDLL